MRSRRSALWHCGRCAEQIHASTPLRHNGKIGCGRPWQQRDKVWTTTTLRSQRFTTSRTCGRWIPISTSPSLDRAHVLSLTWVAVRACCCALAERGHRVTGVDPAATMLAVARRKPRAEQVEWVESSAQTYKAHRRFDLGVSHGPLRNMGTV